MSVYVQYYEYNKEWELADLQPRLHVCGCPSAHFSCGSLQHAAVTVDRQTWSCAKLAQLAHLERVHLHVPLTEQLATALLDLQVQSEALLQRFSSCGFFGLVPWKVMSS